MSPVHARKRRAGRGCGRRQIPAQGRRRHPQARHPDRMDRNNNQTPSSHQYPHLPPEQRLSNRQLRELGGVMIFSKAHTRRICAPVLTGRHVTTAAQVTVILRVS